MKILIAAGKEPTDRTDVLDVLRCRDSVRAALTEIGHSAENLDITPDRLSDPQRILDEIAENHADLVFNLFEGWSYDSGSETVFAELLENQRIPFTGNRSATLSACLDKMGVKSRLARAGIPVPAGTLVRHHSEIGSIQRTAALFIKPCFEDGNVGIDETSFVPESRSDTEFRAAVVEKLMAFPRGVVIEEFIPGIEYSAGCIGNYPYEIIGISVMDYSRHAGFPPFYTYKAKWDETDPIYSALTPVQGARIPGGLETLIGDIVRKAGMELGLASFFRLDMREKDGRVFVLDVNPNPDINTDGGLARQAAARGCPYAQLIRHIVESALPGTEEKNDS